MSSRISFERGLMNHHAPDAETEADFFARTLHAFEKIAQHEELPLIVAHAGTYRALCHFLNIPFKTIPNCSLVYFKAPHDDDQWVIEIL